MALLQRLCNKDWSVSDPDRPPGTVRRVSGLQYAADVNGTDLRRWRTVVVPGLSRQLAPFTRANVVAGVTVTAYLVPQVMAYATIAGLPAIVGLWAAVPALVVYALMGSSPLMSLGPESSVALMTVAVVGPLALGDPGQYAGLAAALALVVGAVGVIASVIRLAFLGDLLSRPVLVGYMAGIGILMIDGQIDGFLGISTDADGLGRHLQEVATGLGDVDPAVPILALLVLVSLFVMARLSPRLPGPLLAVVAAAVLAAVLASLGHTVPLVGAVPQGLPLPAWPAVDSSDAIALLLGGLGVTLVAFTDTTLTGRAFRRRGDVDLEPSSELRALSVGNLGAGILQGMPVSSSGSRTAVAGSSGATSQGYSLIAAIGVIAVLVFAAPALSVLPKAGLAALVIYAALRLIDIGQFRALWRFSPVEFVLALATMIAVLALGLLYGVLVAVALSVVAMAAQVARPASAALGFVPGLAGMHDVDDFDEVAEVPGLLIFRYDSPVFFANAAHFRDEAQRLIDERMPGLRWFALNCEAIVEIDSTAVEALIALIGDVREDGIEFALVRAKRELVDQLARVGLDTDIGADRIFPTLPKLVEAYEAAHPDGPA
jgi:sulfate permease, SulP family